MEVLQIVPFYPPKVGGVESHVYELVQRLRERGHTVYVVTSDQPPIKSSDESHFQRRLPLLFGFKGRWGEIPICPSIFNVLKEFHPDIIHVHTPPRFFSECATFYFRCMSGHNKVPLVATCHLYNTSLVGIPKIALQIHNKSLQRFTFNQADKVIVCNSRDIEILVSEFNIKKEKIVVIPSGVNCNRFDPEKVKHKVFRIEGTEGKKVILYSGRIVAIKGLTYLIQAIPFIRNAIKDFKVVICGTGKHKQDLVKLAKNLNVSSDLIFMDPVPADMYPSLLASCDIFVLASLSESWGISVAEALAMEKPVVASRIKGVTDIIHNEKTGLLFEPGKVQSLTNAIVQLLSDDKLGRRLGKEGRRFVLSNFDWSLLTNRFIDLYEGLLADQRI